MVGSRGGPMYNCSHAQRALADPIMTCVGIALWITDGRPPKQPSYILVIVHVHCAHVNATIPRRRPVQKSFSVAVSQDHSLVVNHVVRWVLVARYHTGGAVDRRVADAAAAATTGCVVPCCPLRCPSRTPWRAGLRACGPTAACTHTSLLHKPRPCEPLPAPTPLLPLSARVYLVAHFESRFIRFQ